MARRVSKAYCVTDVISALFLEKVEALRQAKPDLLEATPQFAAELQKIVKELDAFAKGLQIPDDWRRRALTFITVDIFPRSPQYDSGIISLRLLSSKNGAQWYRTGRGTIYSGPQNRPYTLILPGRMSGHGSFTDIQQIHFYEVSRPVLACALRVIAPDGTKTLINEKGKPAAGVTLKDFKGLKTCKYRGREYTGQYCYQRMRPAINFPPVPLGAIPKSNGLTPDDLLLALRNLPSDSAIGMNIIREYLAATKKTPEKRVPELELYRTLLSRSSENRDVFLSAMRSVRKHLLAQPEAKPEETLATLKSMMSECKAPRAYRRLFFFEIYNHLYDYRKWYHFGAIPWSDSLKLSPPPERAADLPAGEFTVMSSRITKSEDGEKDIITWEARGKPLSFIPAKAPDKKKRQVYHVPGATNKGKQLAWHMATITSTRRKKVHFYLSYRGWRRKPQRTTLWVNQEKLIENHVPSSSLDLGIASTRLNKGENRLLIKTVFEDGWNLCLSIGDSWGAPINGIELVPIAVDETEQKKLPEAKPQPIPIRFVGPFDNKGGKGFDAAYPPERKVNLRRPIKSLIGLTGWEAGKTRADGYFDFLPHFKKKHDNVVAYAVTYVFSPERQKALLSCGSDDGIKAWVNKQLVISNNIARGAAPDQERANIKLRKGWNIVLLKITQGGGTWGFFINILDENQQRLTGIRYADKQK